MAEPSQAKPRSRATPQRKPWGQRSARGTREAAVHEGSRDGAAPGVWVPHIRGRRGRAGGSGVTGARALRSLGTDVLAAV